MANAYKRYHHVFTSASTAEVLTVPAATTAVIKSIIVANTGGTASVTCEYLPTDNGPVVVVPLDSVEGNNYKDLLAGVVAGPLVLEALDVLKITSTAADINVTVSALLVDRS
jgi:hypothetical protein